jgi:hypothetical protein
MEPSYEDEEENETKTKAKRGSTDVSTFNAELLKLKEKLDFLARAIWLPWWDD